MPPGRFGYAPCEERITPGQGGSHFAHPTASLQHRDRQMQPRSLEPRDLGQDPEGFSQRNDGTSEDIPGTGWRMIRSRKVALDNILNIGIGPQL